MAVFGCFVTSLGSDRADRRFHNSSREAPQGCANVSGGTISCHIDTFVDRLAGLYFSAVFLQYLSAKLFLCGNFLWRMLVCGAAFVFTNTQPTFLILFCSSCADQLDRIRFCKQVLYLSRFCIPPAHRGRHLISSALVSDSCLVLPEEEGTMIFKTLSRVNLFMFSCLSHI